MEENLILNIKNADGTDFNDLKLRKFNVSSTVMSLSDKIEGDVYYKDNNLQFTFFEYVEYKGIKYTLKLDTPPVIIKKGIADDNGELRGMTKYSLTFYHPMASLYNFPFTDVAVGSEQGAYKSEDTTFFWSGTITELAAKINQCLKGTDFTCTMQEGFEDNISNSKIIQFSNQTIADALKTAYENFKVPFIIDGYKILFGKPSNEILDSEDNPFVFKMGQGLGLKNNDRNPKNNKIITRIAGYGSEDNIPYGYPKIRWEGDQSWEYTINNNSAEDGSYPIIDGVIDGENVKLIKHPFTRTHLMPSIYVQTLDKKVNPYNPNYNKDTQLVDYYDAIDDESHKYITHINEDAPSYEKHEFADIKPTIEGIKYNGRPIDEFTDITPCDNDGNPMPNWIDTTDAEGKYIQSYFKITLNPLGFDLYAMAAVTKAMSISMKTGATIACNFELAVDKDLFDSNFYVKNDDGDVIFAPNGVQRDLTKFPDSTNQAITIILQKDTTTYGTILPNVYQYPKVGDKFVFLGIDMPYTYILSIQAVLDEAMKQYMLENNAPLYDYPLDFDEYFLTTHKDILAQISTNSIIRFKYGDDVFMLSVKDYNISYGDKALPTYKITLSDDISITLSSIGQVTNGLSQLGSQVASLQALYGKNLLLEIANKLSKVDNDVARGVITFIKGIKFGDYVSGTTGGAITIDKDGKTFAELDYLKVRLKAIFETLEIAHVQSIMGKFIVTAGGSQKITKVEQVMADATIITKTYVPIEPEPTPEGEEEPEIQYEVKYEFNTVKQNVYRCYFLSEQDGVKVENTFRVGDLLMSKGFNLKTIEPEPDNNFLGDFNDDYNDDYLKQRENTSSGSGNRYFWRVVVGKGDDYVDLSIYDCDTNSDKPIEGDTMCHLGNVYDNTRQNAIIISAVDNFSPSITMYQGIEDYSFLEREFINIGVDRTTNKAFLNVYGSMYFGNRDLSSYIKYDETNGVQIKGKLVTQSGKNVDEVLDTYMDIIDGVKETFYGDYTPTLDNHPANGWITDVDKKRHEGDVFTNIQEYVDDETTPDSGKSWRWVNTNDVYSWKLIADSDSTKAYSEAAKAKKAADEARQAADEANTLAESLEDFTNEAFKDGIVDRAEASAINSQLKQLDATKEQVTNSYSEVISSPLLDDLLQNKTNLTKSYNAFINALTELINSISSAIVDGLIEPSEKIAVDYKFDNFNLKYGDYITYLNAANNYIQNKLKTEIDDLTETLQGYEYIKDAIEKNTTTIDGGLILSSLLMLGYRDVNNAFQVMSGVNGIYNNSKSIAAWYGGDMVDMFDYYDYTNGTFVNLPTSYAKGLDRMDGSGYRANGNLWWDTDGQVHADPLSFFVGEDAVGNLLYALFVVENPETGKPYYIQPNLPFYYAEFVDHIQIGKIKIVYDSSTEALKVVHINDNTGVKANLYATGGVSAYGQSSTTGGGGGGLITSVYGYGSLGGTFNDATRTDTFNAYTINKLAERLSAVESSSVTSVDWSIVKNKPTTLSGYGITDAKISNGVITLGAATITPITSHQDISNLAPKATTLSGYGITDAKIVNGVITLGTNTITPITSLSGYATQSWVSNNFNNYTLDKAKVEAVLTGDITTHTHSQYLTSHQDLNVLNINLNGTEIGYYYPIAAEKTININATTSISVPTGLTAGTLTAGGAIAISLTSGYSIPTTTKQGQWDTAYTNSHTHSNKTTLDSIVATDVTWVQGIKSKVFLDGTNVKVDSNLYATGGLSCYSDIRLKSDIRPLTNRGYIQPCTYIKDGKKDIGFIAQDVQELYPELVYEGEYLSLNYSQMTAILEAQIIELRKEIDNLKDKLNGI